MNKKYVCFSFHTSFSTFSPLSFHTIFLCFSLPENIATPQHNPIKTWPETENNCFSVMSSYFYSLFTHSVHQESREGKEYMTPPYSKNVVLVYYAIMTYFGWHKRPSQVVLIIVVVLAKSYAT